MGCEALGIGAEVYRVTGVLAGQLVLLLADYHHLAWAGVLTSPVPAGAALVMAMVATVRGQ